MTSKTQCDPQTARCPAWIDPHRSAFLERLVAQGYSSFVLRGYERVVNRFCAELETLPPATQKIEGAALEAIRQKTIQGFRPYAGHYAKHRLDRFIAYLAEAGAVSLLPPPAKAPSAMDLLRAEYTDYLRRQRALSESTIYHCLGFFERFMRFRFQDGALELDAITLDDIFGFLRQLYVDRAQPHRGKSAPSHLRNFFHFLFWSGKTRRNLAKGIPRIAQPWPVNLPRYLKPEEIERLLEAVRSESGATGRRNYAMLLLVARLGLRAPEAVAIQLEDIDWRAGEILIRGKGKSHERMPLPKEVGEAIVAYLQNGRAGISRALFVSERAPHQGFKDGQIVNSVLQKAFEKTGIEPPQKNIGSHLLRHSLATALLGKGASIEEISHVLRHRSRATTSIYAKCDLAALRSIAQNWPVLEGGAQ